MRKLFLLLGLVTILSIPNVNAAAVNTQLIEQGKFSVGASHYSVFEKDMEYTGGVDISEGDLAIELETKRNETLVNLNYGLPIENINVRVMFGASSFKSDGGWTISEPSGSESGKINIEGNYGLAYGVGATFKKEVLEPGFAVILDAQYIVRKNELSGTLTEDSYVDNLKGDSNSKEWQIAALITKVVGEKFEYYVGASYSGEKTENDMVIGDGDNETFNFDSKKNIGYLAGVKYNFNGPWYLNLGMNGGNELGGQFAVNYKF